MKRPEEQAAGKTREDPHIRILREQFLGAAQSSAQYSIGIPSATRVERAEVTGGYLASVGDDSAAETPVAPVKDR